MQQNIRQIIQSLEDEEIIECIIEINEDKVWVNGIVNPESKVVKVAHIASSINQLPYTSNIKMCSMELLQEGAMRWVRENSL